MTRPRRLPADERRRAIVQAALRVFSSGSYAGATTADIAREAGVSEPVLYRHFDSKRDLWAACLDAAWEEFRDAFDAAVGDLMTRPREEVIALLPEQGAPALPPSAARWKKALMPNLWIQGIAEAGEDREIRKLVARHMRVVHDHLAAALRTGQQTGIVPPDRNPDAEAWVMIGGVLLRSVAHRLGGLLNEADLAAVQRERMRWLVGEVVSGDPSQSPEGEHSGGDRQPQVAGAPGDERGSPAPATRISPSPSPPSSDGVTSAAKTAIGTKWRKRTQNAGSPCATPARRSVTRTSR